MNNAFHNYRRYLSGDPFITTLFSTLEELLNLDALKKHSSQIDFQTFCLRDGMLLAIYEDRMQIIGYIAYPEDVDLPTMCSLCMAGTLPTKTSCKY